MFFARSMRLEQLIRASRESVVLKTRPSLNLILLLHVLNVVILSYTFVVWIISTSLYFLLQFWNCWLRHMVLSSPISFTLNQVKHYDLVILRYAKNFVFPSSCLSFINWVHCGVEATLIFLELKLNQRVVIGDVLVLDNLLYLHLTPTLSIFLPSCIVDAVIASQLWILGSRPVILILLACVASSCSVYAF